MNDFQARIKIAVQRVGSQTQMAKLVSDLIGREIKPQSIQKLAYTKCAKPSTGSSLTTAIAVVSGLRPEWLALGQEPMDDPLASLNPELQRTFLMAAARLAAKNVDDDLVLTMVGAMRSVAKSEPVPYEISNNIASTTQKQIKATA